METKPDRLSVGDALFLHLEREGIPLSVGAVSHFDGKIKFDDLVAYVESKLPLITRYRQRVVPPPLGVGVMMWVRDQQFDIRNHVREIKLKRGTEDELKVHVSHIFSTLLDRRKPLWDLTLFNGMKGGGSVLLTRVHHCLADGVSGVGLLQALMDPSPAMPKLPRKKKKEEAPEPLDQTTRLLDQMTTSWFAVVEGVLSAQSELLKFAQQLAGAATPNGNGINNGLPGNGNSKKLEFNTMAQLLPEFASPPERLPFNIICQGPQRFTYADIPLPRIKAIKNKCGATVNDVVLTLVGMAVRKYAQLHNVATSSRTIRIVIPVNVRTKEEDVQPGNRITFVPLTLPLGMKNPASMVAAVHERTQVLKGLHLGELVAFAGTILGTIPTSVQAILGPFASQLPLSLCNLICTNIPGPQMPLYVLGRKMTTCYPRVPIGGEMGMNIAVITYNGTAYFGFTCDVKAVPDAEVMERLLVECFEELETSVGIKEKRVVRKRAAKPARVDVKVEDNEMPVPEEPRMPEVAAVVERKEGEELAMAVGA
jgi:diacylglycerol O-acyltransferase / wax synthase